MEASTEQTKLAYAAGALEGDGHINISGPPSHGAGVSLTGSLREIPLYMYELLGGSFSEDTSHRPLAKHRMWTWRITGKKAYRMLPKLLPYLIAKKEQAEIVLSTEGIPLKERASYYRELRLLKTSALKVDGKGVTLELSPTTYAYAAGLIDTDGSITFKPASGAYNEHVVLNNTYVALPRTLQLTFGGTIRPYGRYCMDIWNTYGRQASAFLQSIRPYLVAKGGQADCLIKHRKSINEWQRIAPHRPRPGYVKEYRYALYKECKGLKTSKLVPL